jgi:hypothetical protein
LAGSWARAGCGPIPAPPAASAIRTTIVVPVRPDNRPRPASLPTSPLRIASTPRVAGPPAPEAIPRQRGEQRDVLPSGAPGRLRVLPHSNGAGQEPHRAIGAVASSAATRSRSARSAWAPSEWGHTPSAASGNSSAPAPRGRAFRRHSLRDDRLRQPAGRQWRRPRPLGPLEHAGAGRRRTEAWGR